MLVYTVTLVHIERGYLVHVRLLISNVVNAEGKSWSYDLGLERLP
jgi:hypothetical protein